MKSCGCDCHTTGKPAGLDFHVTALSAVPTAISMGVVGGQEGQAELGWPLWLSDGVASPLAKRQSVTAGLGQLTDPS